MPEDHVIIKLDFKNAFNSLRRDAMLEAVEQDVPELHRFAYAAYTVESLLQCGNDTVKSTRSTYVLYHDKTIAESPSIGVAYWFSRRPDDWRKIGYYNEGRRVDKKRSSFTWVTAQ